MRHVDCISVAAMRASSAKLTTRRAAESRRERDRDKIEKLRVGPPKRAIIADDDADHRRLLASVIRRAGFEVLEAQNGEELLDMYDGQHPPDVIVTDLMMPRVSGFGVIEKLRDLESSVPIVLVSAVGDDNMDVLARDLGAAAMVHKPFDFAVLRDLVVRIAGQENGTATAKAGS
ncbi:PleD family two-component system response regulator [Pendulispora albinea]|uniref:Response regulator n=1 Tax=Pendulispora albinea TaxID=2741071 RepID=A0ABZ2LV91_9BACT